MTSSDPLCLLYQMPKLDVTTSLLVDEISEHKNFMYALFCGGGFCVWFFFFVVVWVFSGLFGWLVFFLFVWVFWFFC